MLSLLLLILTTASAQQKADPPKCCVAHQFEAKMGETGGSLYNHQGIQAPVLYDSDNVMHYNYYNRSLVMEVNTYHKDGSADYTRIIQDFSQRWQYVFRGGNCTKSRLHHFRHLREPCIPDNAKYLGRQTLGYGVNSIQTDTWEYPQPGTGTDIKMAVTTDGCVPVVEAFTGVVNGAPSEITLMITDFKPGMTRADLFVLPDVCKNAVEAHVEDQPAHIQRAMASL